MANEAPSIVQRLWNYCHVLRDDGVSYGDYVEQLTYLLFLKMADEQAFFFDREVGIPEGHRWDDLVRLDGPELETHYRDTLAALGRERGLLGMIFRKGQNKIQDPAKLRRLVKLIDEEVWSGLDLDVKGEIYEGLLQKNAEDTKSGAGQYFTPRPLIKAMVACVDPRPGETVCDPACGTGGFFLSAREHVAEVYKGELDREKKRFLDEESFRGWEIVDNTARLCAMNLFLHGVTGRVGEDGAWDTPVEVGDALVADPGRRFHVVLSNPPFGRKSSVTFVGEDGRAAKEALTYERDDFWATTSNKQLNFLQHIKTLLEQHGRAAVVVPDNVLFEGGAGETVRRRLLADYDVHTLLRLPTGIFYAQGVKANVLFFDRKPAAKEPWTRELWVYDLRTNGRFTLRTNPLTDADLADFVQSYNPENRHERQETERFRRFTYEELVARDKASLDLFWLKDDSLEDADALPDPDVLAAEIVDGLRAALEQFAAVAEALEVAENDV